MQMRCTVLYCRFAAQIDLERRAERLRKREDKVARREADVELRQQTAARLAEKVYTLALDAVA